MSDQDIITLDSDDEGDTSASILPDLVVDPSGKAIPIKEARKAGLAGRLPLPPGIPARPPKASASASAAALQAILSKPSTSAMAAAARNLKMPKKPGAFPPFALFSQENRDRVLQDYKDISFQDVGKKMGELWHALTEDEKDDYRRRAREIADQKLKEWHEKMKQIQKSMNAPPVLPPAPAIPPVVAVKPAAKPVQRRRTNAYALFCSEMRRKVAPGLPMAEGTKVCAEHWRKATPTVRQAYEAKAARINEIEFKKQTLLQHQQRQQMLLQNKRLQQQSAASPGIKITEVSSLAPQKPRNVNIPSSITISRVDTEPEVPLIPAGLSIQKMRGPPPLKRGGLQQSSAQSAAMLQRRNAIIQMRQQQQLQQAALLQGISRPGLGGVKVGLQVSGSLKRPMAGPGSGMQLHPKQPKLASALAGTLKSSISPAASPANQKDLVAGSRLCRLCGQSGPYNYLLKDKPESAELISSTLGIDIDMENDTAAGYPDTICRRCVTVLNTYSQFKKSVENGQERLKNISEERKKRQLAALAARREAAAAAAAAQAETAESLEDELEKQEAAGKNSNGKTNGIGKKDEMENGSNDDDSDAIDPLMFVQVSHVEGDNEDENEDDDKGGDDEDENHEEADDQEMESAAASDDEAKEDEENNEEDGAAEESFDEASSPVMEVKAEFHDEDEQDDEFGQDFEQGDDESQDHENQDEGESAEFVPEENLSDEATEDFDGDGGGDDEEVEDDAVEVDEEEAGDVADDENLEEQPELRLHSALAESSDADEQDEESEQNSS